MAVIAISFEFDNIAVKRDEFFSLLIKKLIIIATQKPNEASKFTKRPKYEPSNTFSSLKGEDYYDRFWLCRNVIYCMDGNRFINIWSSPGGTFNYLDSIKCYSIYNLLYGCYSCCCRIKLLLLR